MARLAAFVLCPLAFVLASGCRSCDRVERELRHRETQLRETREALDQCRMENECLQRQLHLTQESGSAKILPEQLGQTTTLKQINLGRMTGGYDTDRCPGDEALQVVLEPRDGDGHAIKSPGNLKVGVLEITPEGVKKPLSCWDVTPEQLRRSWKSGLLGNGYYLVLPWTNWPTTEKLRVVAQLTTADGRTFEADKDIKIRLIPAELRPAPSSSVPEPTAPPPVEGPTLSKHSFDSRPLEHQSARVSSGAPWWQVPPTPPLKPLVEAVHVLRPPTETLPIPVLGPPPSNQSR